MQLNLEDNVQFLQSVPFEKPPLKKKKKMPACPGYLVIWCVW